MKETVEWSILAEAFSVKILRRREEGILFRKQKQGLDRDINFSFWKGFHVNSCQGDKRVSCYFSCSISYNRTIYLFLGFFELVKRQTVAFWDGYW